MKFYHFFVCLVFAFLARTSAVTFSDCGSKDGKVTSVEIAGCETSSTCILKRGGNSTVTINFVPEKGAKSVKSVVHGVIQGLPVPFDFPFPDACQYGGIACPLTGKTAYTYTATLPIKKIYPKIHVQVQWELQNEDEEDIVCVRIPVQIK